MLLASWSLLDVPNTTTTITHLPTYQTHSFTGSLNGSPSCSTLRTYSAPILRSNKKAMKEIISIFPLVVVPLQTNCQSKREGRKKAAKEERERCVIAFQHDGLDVTGTLGGNIAWGVGWIHQTRRLCSTVCVCAHTHGSSFSHTSDQRWSFTLIESVVQIKSASCLGKTNPVRRPYIKWIVCGSGGCGVVEDAWPLILSWQCESYSSLECLLGMFDAIIFVVVFSYHLLMSLLGNPTNHPRSELIMTSSHLNQRKS